MNIDCLVNKVEIYSQCIQNIASSSIGSQKFLNSVSIVTIIYYFDSNPNIKEDLNLLHEYFKNLEHINLDTIKGISLAEIVEILKNWKINQISIEGASFDHENEFLVESND